MIYYLWLEASGRAGGGTIGSRIEIRKQCILAGDIMKLGQKFGHPSDRFLGHASQLLLDLNLKIVVGLTRQKQATTMSCHENMKRR